MLLSREKVVLTQFNANYWSYVPICAKWLALSYICWLTHFKYTIFHYKTKKKQKQEVQGLQAFAFPVVIVSDKHYEINQGSKKSLGVKFKESICTKLWLKLWFESSWYICNISKSGWFLKRLFRKKVLHNHFLKSLQKQPYKDVLQNRCF